MHVRCDYVAPLRLRPEPPRSSCPPAKGNTRATHPSPIGAWLDFTHCADRCTVRTRLCEALDVVESRMATACVILSSCQPSTLPSNARSEPRPCSSRARRGPPPRRPPPPLPCRGRDRCHARRAPRRSAHSEPRRRRATRAERHHVRAREMRAWVARFQAKGGVHVVPLPQLWMMPRQPLNEKPMHDGVPPSGCAARAAFASTRFPSPVSQWWRRG